MNKLIMSAVAASLTATNFAQYLNQLLQISEDVVFKPFQATQIVSERFEAPIILEGYPELPDDSNTEELGSAVFGGVMVCYGYNPISVVILAPDVTYANSLAQRFREKLDLLIDRERLGSSNWNIHIQDEPISPPEVLTIGGNGNLVYTLMPGNTIIA